MYNSKGDELIKTKSQLDPVSLGDSIMHNVHKEKDQMIAVLRIGKHLSLVTKIRLVYWE